jgi:hypothetical protein
MALTKWEYLQLMSPTIEKMNELGEDGWELVLTAINAEEMTRIHTFKRPRDHGGVR